MDKQIIFFDGVCNLCNFFVDFVVKRDLDQKFQFASIQGETGKRTLPAEARLSLRSVVLWTQGQHFERSDAALMVLQQLGGLWGAFRIFWVVPRPIRDFLYGLVARYRYFLFGKRETCRLPTPAERARFLD
ncbi:MAG: thiol-disulfide oxidoreductase DCC family protein [Bacteriovoracia bacterium]